MATFNFCFEYSIGLFEFRGPFDNHPKNEITTGESGAEGSGGFYIFYRRNNNCVFMPELLRRYFTWDHFSGTNPGANSAILSTVSVLGIQTKKKNQLQLVFFFPTGFFFRPNFRSLRKHALEYTGIVGYTYI